MSEFSDCSFVCFVNLEINWLEILIKIIFTSLAKYEVFVALKKTR